MSDAEFKQAVDSVSGSICDAFYKESPDEGTAPDKDMFALEIINSL